MKVKVRGLVFVGFAAAVFATSAMADAASDTAAKKTVTSKYYVDQTFQTKDNIVTVEEAATAANWTSETTYPSMAVLKGVKDSLDAVGVIDDGAGYVDVQPGTGANAGKYVVGLDKTPVTGNTGITGTFGDGDGNKLVTAQGVKSLIDTTAISSSSDATHLPTSQAVYNYAQPKVSTANALQVGYYTGSGDAAWKTLQADDTANVTHYVSIAQKTGDTNTYNVNLDNSTITSATSDFVASNDTNQATKRPKLATAGAVYDFVTSQVTNAAYQPEVTGTSTANTVSIGYNSNGSTPTWGTLAGASGGYVTINGSNGTYTVNIDSNQIADQSSEIVTNSGNLATAGAVYDFVSGGYQVKNTTDAPMVAYGNAWRQLTASGTIGASGNTYVVMQSETDPQTNAVSYKINLASASIANHGTDISNSTVGDVAGNDYTGDLTTARAVKEYVASQVDTQFALGTNPCNASTTAGHYCALVAYYDADTANGGANPGVKYEWTLMAPTGN